MVYRPHFQFSARIISLLNGLEYCRGVIESVILPVDISASLRRKAKIKATHYSTAIEGNPLTIQQVEETIEKKLNKSKSEQEVRNYWDALNYLSRASNRRIPVTEDFVRKLHAIIEVRGPGRRGGKSNYRGSMPPGFLFAVWDKETGQPDYIPPSHEDVPVLMRELISWFNSREAEELPVPIKAAIFAYQLVTIHPFEDGNGRTARAMANYILMRQGYDLRGFYSVEEHYAADLASYYSNLQMGLPVNYYDGRNDPELSPWLLFFLESMYKAYQDVVNLTRSFTESAKVKLAGLGEKDKRLLLLALQFQKPLIPVTIANWFGVNPKTIHNWIKDWLRIGLLEPASGSVRVRSYKLGRRYENITIEELGFSDKV